MQKTIWVVMSKRGLIRAQKSVPTLQVGQVAFPLTIAIPDKAFRTIAVLGEAKINVPDESLVMPPPDVAIPEPEEGGE